MQVSDIVIVSAGKFAREMITWIDQAIQAGLPWRVKGFLDNRPGILDDFACGAGVIGSVDDYVIREGDLFISAIGDPADRKSYVQRLERRGARFTTFVHPAALVGRTVQLGAGTVVGPLAQLSCDIRIGKHVFFGTNGNAGHDVTIGDFCQVCGSCEINGNVSIGNGVFIGSHATLLPGCTIGDEAYIGAGSVVLRRVRPFTKVFGNPARVIGRVDDPA